MTMMRSSGVALAGLATSVLTALLVVFIQRQFQFSVFGFYLWFVVPVGAIACGFVAASGYYLAAKALHQGATRLLLAQMILIAAATLLLIYWLEYRNTMSEGVPISGFVPFTTYLDTIFRTMSMSTDDNGGTTGELGAWGYGFALLDLIGFLVGALVVYFALRDQPSCGRCDKYLRPVAKRQTKFEDENDFNQHYDDEFAHPLGSPEFARHVSRPSDRKGTINLATKVLACPGCGDQTITQTVQVKGKQGWQPVAELGRLTPVPSGIDVASAYRAP